MDHTVYMDYAAATPLDERVEKAMRPYLEQLFYNPSATYLAARSVQKDLESARRGIAAALGVRSSEIVFTAGGTEANNLAIHGIMSRHRDATVLASAIEHESVLAPLKAYQHHLLPVARDGRLDSEAIVRQIDDQTVLVSVQYANNEIGTIQPLPELARQLETVRHDRRQRGVKLPLYLHSDACQAAGYLDMHVSRLGVDLLTLNGSKIYGPKQSGALYVRGGIELEPLINGGGQEHGLRSGTENVAACVGLAEALKLAQQGRSEEIKRLQTLQRAFLDLLANCIPTATVNGSRRHRLPNNVHVTIPGHDNERLLMALDEKGIMAAAGSACSASNEEPSHVLAALGLDEAAARSSLRFTMGRPTTENDVRLVVTALADLLA